MDSTQLSDKVKRGEDGAVEETFVEKDIPEPQTSISREESRAVLRRIDYYLIPVMTITYALQFYDKSVLNQAALFGIIQELGLSTTSVVEGKSVVDTSRYSYVGMVFYCGYILGVYPATLAVQKYRSGKVCAMLVLSWGVVETLTVACTSFAGLMAQRFFLGFLEAGIAPAFVIASGHWYTPGESAFRIAIWWSGNAVAAVVGPLTSYGFGSIPGSLSGWRNIYLFAGLLTVAWSAAVFWFIPDDIRTAKFLSERQRVVAMERVRDNNTGLVEHRIKSEQIAEALLDPLTWLLATAMFGAASTNSITGIFASVIISNLGFSTLQSLCLQIPVGAFGLICCGLIPNYIILKTGKWRTTILSILMTLSLVGTAMLYGVPRSNVALVLVGYYFNNFYVGGPNLVLALVAANIGGHTKKTTVSSIVFVAYCAASTMSPLIMKGQDNYKSGFLGILVCQCYTIIAAQVIHFVYRRRNKSRDTQWGPQNSGQEFTDDTDIDNTNFRYHT